MRKLAIELTEDEREEFVEYFYDAWDLPYDTDEYSDISCPWGCPWYRGNSIELKGNTIKEMAENYWVSVREDIKDACHEDEINRREHGCCGGNGCMRCLGLSNSDFF